MAGKRQKVLCTLFVFTGGEHIWVGEHGIWSASRDCWEFFNYCVCWLLGPSCTIQCSQKQFWTLNLTARNHPTEIYIWYLCFPSLLKIMNYYRDKYTCISLKHYCYLCQWLLHYLTSPRFILKSLILSSLPGFQDVSKKSSGSSSVLHRGIDSDPSIVSPKPKAIGWYKGDHQIISIQSTLENVQYNP